MKAVDDLLVPEASSKERILRAAQAIFAQKGFDGARVDEIARAAGVNKALIYYYFKSKEEILHALLHLAIEDIGIKLGDPAELMKNFLDTRSGSDEMVVKFVAFIKERKELLTIVMMELLKGTERREIILRHLADEVWQTEAFNRLGADIDPAKAKVMEFFTGLIPVLMFVLLSDSWQSLYGQSETELTKLFIEAFEGTHIRYSLGLFDRSKGAVEKEKE